RLRYAGHEVSGNSGSSSSLNHLPETSLASGHRHTNAGNGSQHTSWGSPHGGDPQLPTTSRRCLAGDRVAVSNRKLTGWIMSRPSDLSGDRRAHLHELVTASAEMTRLAVLVRDFAEIMTERRGGDLDCWIKQAREAGLPELEPFLRGLDQDHDAAVAGLTLPYPNGPCEGVNTKTK